MKLDPDFATGPMLVDRALEALLKPTIDHIELRAAVDADVVDAKADLLETIGCCDDDVELWQARLRQIPLERNALDMEVLTLERDIAMRTARKFELMLELVRMGGAL